MTASAFVSRRQFLRLAAAAGAALALPLVPRPAEATGPAGGRSETVGDATNTLARPIPVYRPAGDPSFQPWWVQTFLATNLWPDPEETHDPLERVRPGRFFRVEEPQDGYRLRVWDARENRQVFIGAEAVGPADAPFWADFSEDGRWIDVSLALPQHLVAMQGDQAVFEDLVTAGV